MAGIAAESEEQRVAAQFCLADIPLREFTRHSLIPYEADEVTRLICDRWDAEAFKPIAHLTVGEFREYLLQCTTTNLELSRISAGLFPEMLSAVSKIMRNQDLIAVARKVEVTTRFRSTVGKKGHLSIRLQPNHPTDDLKAITAATVDGLLYGRCCVL